ncbi:MAG: SDR family oxidoreductase [Candidatus Omnitrophica bacterium]|nr:SDR family oxidoreductase [Candidatus Omnitrophota bacterium]
MKNVLIIGASGLVGSYLYRLISPECNTVGTFQNYPLDDSVYLDITSIDAVRKIIDETQPDFVFLPAALTNVDFCEENKEACFKINIEAVKNIALILKDKKAKLIYFSTDFIFNGQNGPYGEEDLPAPLGVYGQSKLEAEKAVRENLVDYLIIRTTCIYGWEPQEKNFVVNLIKKNRVGSLVEVASDQITTPTYAGSLAALSWKLAKAGKEGIYNITGSTVISRLDFAFLVAKVFSLNRDLIVGVTTEQLKRRARRPLNGGLKIAKVEKEFGIGISGAEQGLLEMKKEKHG